MAFSPEVAAVLSLASMHAFAGELRGPFVVGPGHTFSDELRESFVMEAGHSFSLELAQQFYYPPYLGPRLIRGAQLHRGVKRTEWFQGANAPMGVDTALFRLADRPQSRAALRLFVGVLGTASGRLMVLGLDFDVDLLSRVVTWLATARWPLIPTNVVTLDYYAQGYTT